MVDTIFMLGIILVSVRLSTFFVASQVLIPAGTPAITKIIVILGISYLITPSIDLATVGQMTNMGMLVIYIIAEALTGFMFGFVTFICFEAISFAGSLVDFQAGLTMMSVFDPAMQSNTTMIQKIFNYLALCIVFVFDGHHLLLKTIINTFNHIPIGQTIVSQGSIMSVVQTFIQFFETGLRIALPIIFILLVCDVIMGVVSRTVPQINVMILGMPLKFFITLVLLFLLTPMILRFINLAFDKLPASFRDLYAIFPVLIFFADADKTEDPTGKKLSDARNKGQVARSKEIPATFSLLASGMILTLCGGLILETLKNGLLDTFRFMNVSEFNVGNIGNILVSYILKLGIILIPIAGSLMIVGVASNIAQFGFMFTGETLKPDFNKINPISGFKNMFSIRNVVDLVKNLAMISLITFIGIRYFTSQMDSVMRLSILGINEIPGVFISIIVKLFYIIGIAMLAIALADFVFQKWKYKKDMKMSKHEVKEEFKQMEGNQEVKAKRREKMKEIASRAMMAEVPNATVVITNPTHISVALKYDTKKSEAPFVVAKGQELVALKIKELAKENNIPIVENKPLARLMYSEIEVNQQIPVDMYAAVAEILAVVMK